MDSKKVEKIIVKKCKAFLGSLPKKLRGQCLLTGGSAAFLYGSDRPFSNDIDFMIPEKSVRLFEKSNRIRFKTRKHRWAIHKDKKWVEKMESHLKIRFEYRKHKPVFHSLAASVTLDGTSYDLVAKSVIEPIGQRHQFALSAIPAVMRRKTIFNRGGIQIACLPKEWLVLTKLLAGRGKELGKYDLYDVEKILGKNKDFDFDFFKSLVKTFCKPLKTALVILRHHAERLKSSERVRILQDSLDSLR